MSREKQITRKFIRLPHPQAVPFTGFRFAKIPSRNSVEKNLRSFLKKTREARSLTVAVIKAEWGEGKTDAFERYIKPEVESQGDIAYLVSTSTIVNKLSKAGTLFPTSPPESQTLLTTIFYSVKDELKARGENYTLFPKEKEFEDTLLYIKETLENHLGDARGKKRRMYIFIDEFEEILLQPIEIQRKFLSGIKELINGQLGMIHENGEFQGCLHFIIACTPYAYNRLKEDVNLKQIFGSISSRIGMNVIELPQISREESLKFLMDIIKYCYNGEIPRPFVVKSSGILNSICTISQRNLRPMIQLLVELLNAASFDRKLYVIDYNILIDTLKGREISIYGEVTSCIDNDLWGKIERALINIRNYGDKCLELFKMLAGELKPFSVQEIAQRLGFSETEIHKLVEMINQELRKIGISRAISRFEPLKETKDINSFIESLKPVNGQIILLNSKIPLSVFKDELIHFELMYDGKISPIMVFPREIDEFVRLFETYEAIEIDEGEAEAFKRRIRDYYDFSAKNRRFMLSKEITLQLYPSPLVMQLDFIIDRPKRMSLWREAVKNFADMEKELRDGFIEVINVSDRFKISGHPEIFTLKYYPKAGMEVDLTTFIYPSTTGININDIINIRKILRRTKVDIVLLIYTGTIDEEASKELEEIPKVLPVHLKTIRAQQLIAFSLARKRDKKSINSSLLEGTLKQIFYEIDFTRLFESWVEKCREQGLLIEDLIKTSGEKDESLAQVLVYYIETIEKEFTLNDIFEQMNRLKKFRLYGGRSISFDPLDVDVAQLDSFKEWIKAYHLDLIRNSFIQENLAGKIQIIYSPVENRILKILRSGKKSVEKIKQYFIFFAQNKRILEQVYLPILESKGLIKITEDELLLLNRQEVEQEILKKYDQYIRDIEEQKNSEVWSFAHICISKARESKVIMLSEFDEYIRLLRQKYDDPAIKYDEELSMRLLRHMAILLEYFRDSLEPKVKDAYAYSNKLTQEIKGIMEDAEFQLSRILEEYNKYSHKKYSLKDVEEYNQLVQRLREFENVMLTKYSREEIENEVDLLDSMFKIRKKFEGRPRYFYFNARPEESSYFNCKVYKLERTLEAFKKINDKIKAECWGIRRLIEKSFNTSNKIKSKFVTFIIPENFVLSKLIHDLLVNYQMEPIEAKPLVSLCLNDIKLFFVNLYNSLGKIEGKVNTTLIYLKRILDKEKVLLPMMDNIIKKANSIKNFFKGFDKETGELSLISVEIIDSKSQYEKLKQNILQNRDSSLDLDEINKVAEEIDEKLEKIEDSLVNADKALTQLCKRYTKNLETYEQNVNKFLEVLKEGGINVIELRRVFKAIIDETIESLKHLSLGYEAKMTWKDVQSDIEHLKKKLFESVNEMLSEDEFNTLFLVVESSVSRDWFESSELVKKIMSKFDKSREEAEDIIENLVSKKLLRKSFSLPI